MERWQSHVAHGEYEAAWDAFLDHYRPLLLATIRRLLSDHDDVMDAFTHVCEGLRTDHLRRLRAYAPGTDHRARFSTWLVVVVRNLVVDWIRERKGRSRAPASVAGLAPLERSIHELVFLKGRGHGEAFEILHSRDPGLSFSRYLKALRVVYATRARDGRVSPGPAFPSEPSATAPPDAALQAETRLILEGALGTLSDIDRVAIQLYVMEGLDASEVARVLGLPTAKTVYNRVYRALASLRALLEEAGYRAGSF